ncbi:MAG: tetrathionate reductase family octaheme c-type cytochrome [Acidobacteria bacterium]|nr:tetrathionate reductase family octaheme c-type cytochrome [Acidobacteriota bacterium]
MGKVRQHWLIGVGLMIVIFAVPLWVFLPRSSIKVIKNPWNTIKKVHVHLDHSPFFKRLFNGPQEVTKACLECHPQAAKDFMKTAHWNWEGDMVDVPGHNKPMKIGKKNLLNNFCISIQGNWANCTACHAGYGWGDDTFDFTKQENVDCLICHDWSGTYVKGDKGLPKKDVDLAQVAGSVGYPRRDNCGICHIYGGGGMGVKHGDLDNTLVNPTENIDVHMGKHNLLCIDCHKTQQHNIKGKAYSVSVNHENGINCTDCHEEISHKDRRIDTHLSSIACQTCHIPTYARKAPTKMDWDWSKAGNLSREDDDHHYLKIKGEFIYNKNVVPEYAWFNLKSYRYLQGDIINPGEPTFINKAMGDINDKNARIWPFRIHRAKQPYDKVYNHLLPPVTSGEGGFWTEFDWHKALQLGAEIAHLPYSGQYGFTITYMQWPLSHMVAPSQQALRCFNCHGENSRLDWKALGYEGDPEKYGARKTMEGK